MIPVGLALGYAVWWWFIGRVADFKDAQQVLGNDAGIPKEYCNFKYRMGYKRR